MRKSLERVFQTGETDSYQVGGVGLPHGPTCWYETHVGPIKRDGQVVALTLINTDIAERKRAEEIIRRQLAAIEVSMDGIAILNQNAEYTFLNDAHAKLHGYESPKELIGKTWRKLYDEQEIKMIEQEMEPVLLIEGQGKFMLKSLIPEGRTLETYSESGGRRRRGAYWSLMTKRK